MNPTDLPRPLRLALYAGAVAVLLYLCLAPRDEVPQGGVWDKQEHAIGWLVLTVAGLMLSNNRPRAIAVFALAVGVFVEIAQATMNLGRDGDARDLVADALGVAVALIGYRAYLLTVRRPRPGARDGA